MLAIFLELNSKGLYLSSQKEKENRCLIFAFSIKREIRKFHVVVLQRQQSNVQKRVMHLQSCFFANLKLWLFCCSRCRLRRHCLSCKYLWNKFLRDTVVMDNIHLALSDLTDLLDFVSCIAKTFTQEHLIIFYFVNIHVGSLSWIIQNLNWFPGFGNILNHPCDLSQNGNNTSNLAKIIYF